jgi:hypothetical protein
LGDSTGKLDAMFGSLTWRIELVPAEGGHPALVRGTETAHTRNWRARMFAGISERILLNQAFFPDVIQLGAIENADDPNPYPKYSL